MPQDEIDTILTAREAARELEKRTRSASAQREAQSQRASAQAALNRIREQNHTQKIYLKRIFDALTPIIKDWRSRLVEGAHLSFRLGRVKEDYRPEGARDEDGHDGEAWKAASETSLGVELYRRPCLYLYVYKPSFANFGWTRFRYRVTVDGQGKHFLITPQGFDNNTFTGSGQSPRKMEAGWRPPSHESGFHVSEMGEKVHVAKAQIVNFLKERLADHVEATRSNPSLMIRARLKPAAIIGGIILAISLLLMRCTVGAATLPEQETRSKLGLAGKAQEHMISLAAESKAPAHQISRSAALDSFGYGTLIRNSAYPLLPSTTSSWQLDQRSPLSQVDFRHNTNAFRAP